jgi:hypothetical protein
VTGDIKVVEPDSAEFHKLVAERIDDAPNRPLYEQTSAGDADPKNSAAAEEVARREEHDLPIHDVTSDGVPQSDKSVAKLEKKGVDTVDPPSGKK